MPKPDDRATVLSLTGPEYDAALAGLRLLATALRERRVAPNDGDIGMILTCDGEHAGLDAAEIDALGDRWQGMTADPNPEPLPVVDIRPGDRVDLQRAPGCDSDLFLGAEFEFGRVMGCERERVNCVRLDFENFPSIGFDPALSLPVVKATPRERAEYAGYDVEPNGFAAGWILRDRDGDEVGADYPDEDAAWNAAGEEVAKTPTIVID